MATYLKQNLNKINNNFIAYLRIQLKVTTIFIWFELTDLFSSFGLVNVKCEIVTFIYLKLEHIYLCKL